LAGSFVSAGHRIHNENEEVVKVSREQLLAATFVEMADTLVADFDVAEFLHVLATRCTELVGASAAGIMLADHQGKLRLIAASSERSRLLELFELEANEGPCVACYRGGEPATAADLRTPDERWPNFGRQALEAGFSAAHAQPLRLRDQIIGVLNLFYEAPGRPDPEDAQVSQALADVATIGLLQERAVRHHGLLVEQLQTALNSRVVIEQAKGMLAERLDLNMDDAFSRLRAFARAHNMLLSNAAYGVVRGTITPE
jgi:transcriptional regulator with GAF, ATPase, and Fis domain